jgi:phosphoglycerol transferase MdoB-like AlkP superfamily enzyme
LNVRETVPVKRLPGTILLIPVLYGIILKGDFMDLGKHAFFILLITAKACIYYELIGIERYSLVTVLLTAAYMAVIYFLCGSKKLVYCGISLLISVLMLVNVLYNRYFHLFFSLGTISQAGKLREVGAIALGLLKPVDLLLFIDPLLPVVAMSAIKRFRQQRRRMTAWVSLGSRVLMLMVLAGSLVFFAVNPLGSRLVTAVNHQEIFTWYFRDAFFKSETDAGHAADTETIRKEIEMEIGRKIEAEMQTATDEQSSEKTYLHGAAAGRNLIVIQLESFQDFLVNAVYNGREITPNLNKLVAGESIYFTDYYQQLGRGNTSDAEFVTNNSLYPVIYGPVYELYYNNRFYGLPWVLKENGYRAIALHGYKKSFWNRDKAYPGQGFDMFIGEEDLVVDEKIGFGLSDKSFFRQATDILLKTEQPFYSFIITLSSHVPYKLPESHQKLELMPEDKDTLLGDYLQAVHYADEATGEFIDSLKENGLYNNSMIILYGDHFGIDCTNDAAERVKAFLGRDYNYDGMMNVPMVIHIPGSGIHETVETAGGQVDFMPTVLNLLGISGKNLVMFGKDLLQGGSGFVASQTYMLKGSFIDDRKVFEMARTGVFEDSRAWDKKTGEPVNIDTCREGYEKALAEIAKCTYLLENDLLKGMNPGGTSGSASADADIPDNTQSGDEVLMQHDTIIDITMITETDEYPGIPDTAFSKGFRLYLTELGIGESDSVTLPGRHDFDLLSEWLAGHPDAFLVVPVSNDNIGVLKLLNRLYPDICPQIILKIHDLGDYVKAEYRGFRRIILDLSALNGIDADDLALFLDRNRVSGALMSEEQASDRQLLEMLESKKITILKMVPGTSFSQLFTGQSDRSISD